MSIFISVASYCDDLLMQTLTDAHANAARPELLHFGVVDQDDLDRRPEIDALPFRAQVSYLRIDPLDARGAAWARHLAFSLYDGSTYLLQIDAHTVFDAGWDTVLVEQLEALRRDHPKPVLTTYPPGFTLEDGRPVKSPVAPGHALVLRPNKEAVLTLETPAIGFAGAVEKADAPVPACHVGGGLLFTLGAFVEEVPYDPFLYFAGEEQDLAVRAFSRGWALFHPLRTPIYHLYKRGGTAYRGQHWNEAMDTRRTVRWSARERRSSERLRRKLFGDGAPGAYGLGDARGLDEFARRTGIDYRRMTLGEPSAAPPPSPPPPPVPGRNVGVASPVHDRPDLARLLVLQLMAQTRPPDVLCVFQNGDPESYVGVVEDLRPPFELVWMHSRLKLPIADWYRTPFARLLELGCTDFFWCDHDDLYRTDHVAQGLARLEGHDVSVNLRCGLLKLKPGATLQPDVRFDAHAPGGMCSSLCFNRPFAEALVADLARAEGRTADQVLAQETMPRFRVNRADRNTTTYVAHAGALTSRGWVTG